MRSDYEALVSDTYAPAFERYAVALRLVCRLAAACASPAMAMRKLVVPAADGNGGDGDGNGTPLAAPETRRPARKPRPATG